MSYKTRKEAVSNWVPSDAVVLFQRDGFVLYLWQGNLKLLAVFELGSADFRRWHVSMDFDQPVEKIMEMIQ